ncbi:MAG TPA: hypothetical protein VEQ60_08430, partial [Longimicrobium sp.]|nr:hypothetical protein [Longimicrobium sp.]
MRRRRWPGLIAALLRPVAVLPALAAGGACGSAAPAEGWRGSRTLAGDTAVVTTEAGYAVAPRVIPVAVRQLWKSDSLQQAVAIAVLGDTLLVVADRDRIHLLSLAGGPQGTLGRPGSGPGEFRSIQGVAAVDGGILVWDGAAARLTWLDAGRRVARTAPVDPPVAYATPMPVDLAPSAGGVALAWSPSMLVPGRPPTTRVVFHPFDGGAARDLAAVRSVALVPVPRLLAMVPHEVYGPVPLFAVSPRGTLAVSDGTAFRVDLHPADGGRVVRLVQGGAGAPLSRCERSPCVAGLRREVALTTQDETFLRERMRVQRRSRRRSRLDALVYDD